MLSAGENRIRRIVAIVAAALSLVCLPFAGNRPLFLTGYLLLVIAIVLLLVRLVSGRRVV